MWVDFFPQSHVVQPAKSCDVTPHNLMMLIK